MDVDTEGKVIQQQHVFCSKVLSCGYEKVMPPLFLESSEGNAFKM
jgi:hypothetical protein